MKERAGDVVPHENREKRSYPLPDVKDGFRADGEQPLIPEKVTGRQAGDHGRLGSRAQHRRPHFLETPISQRAA